jgi:hypothetical protein
MLNQIPQAIERYQAARKLAGPENWSDEAKSALHAYEMATGYSYRSATIGSTRMARRAGM